MAYPVGSLVTETGTSTENTIEVALPDHEIGDLVIILLSLDGAGTSTTYTYPPVWTEVSKQASGGAGQLILRAVASSALLEPPVITTSISDGMNAVAIAIRDADVTGNPVDSIAYVTRIGASGITSPDLTTNSAGTLLLALMSEDQAPRLSFPLSQLHTLGQSFSGAVTSVAGYRVGYAAGAAPVISGGRGVISDTVMFTYLAIKNAPGGRLAPEFSVPPEEISALHGYTVGGTGITAITGAAIVDGYSFYDSGESVNNDYAGEYHPFTHYSFGTTANQPGWYGRYVERSPIDFTSGVLTVRTLHPEQYGTLVGLEGFICVIGDADGNWSAYRLFRRTQITYDQVSSVVIDFRGAPALGGSPTQPNLASITRVGFAGRRIDTVSTTATAFRFAQALYWPDETTWAGGLASHGSLAAMLDAAEYRGLLTRQGSAQVASKVPLKLGDGTTKTEIYLGPGTSTALLSENGLTRIQDESLNITVEAGAQDAIDFGFASVSSGMENRVTIDPTSSPSATYIFAGAVLRGVRFDLGGVAPCEGANLFGCYTTETGGASLIDCDIAGALESPAARTNNPGNVIDCAFTQGPLGGHAIEITQPGTFAFVGNTFEGYGLDGTTDASIYNNSGGHVVLNVSGGGDTPTVRNGAGATTEVLSGAQVAVIGLATGSQVKVTKVSNGDVLFNGAESGGQISFSTTYIGAVRVDARKASASPFYKPWATQATTISGQTVEVTALQELDE